MLFGKRELVGGVMANDYEVLREKFRRVEIVLIRVQNIVT
jgi:hypothetical protein